LISDLEFTASANGSSATMGQALTAAKDGKITVTVRFRTPERNNYQSFFNTDTGIAVDNIPDLDHVDLIMGHVTGKVDSSAYASTDNTDAKIIRTFSKEELAAAKGEDGVYTLTYEIPADGDLYIRLRGTSVSEVDENGDPYSDEVYKSISDNNTRFDTINDANYASLCFYANPIWVNVGDGGITLDVSALSRDNDGRINGSISVNFNNVTAKARSRVYTAVYGGDKLLGVGGIDLNKDLSGADVTVTPWTDVYIDYSGPVTVKATIVDTDGITPLYPSDSAQM
ncbi:MAG: hypothetical protein ACI4SS_03010, partial [Clostridia bacterium]